MNPELEEVKQFQIMCENISVLMVDDEVNLTRYYKEIASHFFQNVEIANSGKEALEKFSIGKYDIIYTDLNMPGIDGLELIKQIKETDDRQKFIVISASNELEKLMKLLSLNISGFILKPFNLDSFIRTSIEQVSIILQIRRIKKETNNLNNKLLKVTKEKEDQEQMLIQQSKLAQTGEMISMIAHQWRQPLSSITTIIAGLKSRLELGLYEQKENPNTAMISDFKKAFEKIENSAEFLSKTINDFRNFYRPDNEKKHFNVCDTVENVLSMLNLEKKDVFVEFTCIAPESSSVFTFEGELKQVFISIINNAIDALEEKQVSDKKISISSSAKNENVIVRIADNAGGIPLEIIDNIFLAYFSTKNKKNGTGLGLHMAKTIIEHHMNGSLTVINSEITGGAEFMISMPQSKQEGQICTQQQIY